MRESVVSKQEVKILDPVHLEYNRPPAKAFNLKEKERLNDGIQQKRMIEALGGMAGNLGGFAMNGSSRSSKGGGYGSNGGGGYGYGSNGGGYEANQSYGKNSYGQRGMDVQ